MASFNLDDAVKSRINSQVFRYVESDLEIASVKLVDTVENQNRLEELIDQSKPKISHSMHHYLLKTPFRYPPLDYGSRFGTVMMPSFFYGSKNTQTCLAEAAYYHFLFDKNIKAIFDKPLTKNYLVFSAKVQSSKTLDLTKGVYDDIRSLLMHPSDYTFTQEVGEKAIMDGDFNVIKYNSARYIPGFNVAISKPDVIKSKNPENMQRVASIANQSQVVFKANDVMFSFPNTIIHTPVA